MMGWASCKTAAIGVFRPLIRPCGMATPWPNPVEPNRSLENKLSVTRLRLKPCKFSNSRPTSSKALFLLVTSVWISTWSSARMAESRFMMSKMRRLKQKGIATTAWTVAGNRLTSGAWRHRGDAPACGLCGERPGGQACPPDHRPLRTSPSGRFQQTAQCP